MCLNSWRQKAFVDRCHCTHVTEAARDFVDHLYDPNDLPPNLDGHAEDGLRIVSCLVIDSPVKPVVQVNVRYVHGPARLGNVTGDSDPNREPVTSTFEAALK